MRTKKLWMTAALLSGTMYVNAQTTSAIESTSETGYGLQNGAVGNASSATTGGAFFGYQAGRLTTTSGTHGNYNTFLGHQSGYNNLSGNNNLFGGSLSGYNNTSGINNVFLGSNAGYSNTNTTNNTFVGYYAGYSTTNNNNSFYGCQAGRYNTTGEQNTFLGTNAGRGTSGNSSGGNNVMVGFNSGFYNTIGNSNAFLGHAAGFSNTSGTSNVFLGASAGSLNSTSSYNIFIGNAAGYTTASGNGGNVFIGHAAGSANTTGWGNTYIGHTAGINATGSNNVFLGNSAGKNETGNNKLYISNADTATPLIYGDFSTNKVGIGGINNSYATVDKFPSTASGVPVSGYSLFVKGGILTEEVRIALQTAWADYVFADDYKLLPLAEVEQYIIKNGHLPNVPSAEQIQEEGMAVGEITVIQQEKIEELTLYVIEQNKQLEKQQKEIEELKAAVKTLASKQ